MTEVVGRLAEIAGRVIGYLLSRQTISALLELVGAVLIVWGLATWSIGVAMIALGGMLLATSYRWNSESEEH